MDCPLCGSEKLEFIDKDTLRCARCLQYSMPYPLADKIQRVFDELASVEGLSTLPPETRTALVEAFRREINMLSSKPVFQLSEGMPIVWGTGNMDLVIGYDGCYYQQPGDQESMHYAFTFSQALRLVDIMPGHTLDFYHPHVYVRCPLMGDSHQLLLILPPEGDAPVITTPFEEFRRSVVVKGYPHIVFSRQQFKQALCEGLAAYGRFIARQTAGLDFQLFFECQERYRACVSLGLFTSSADQDIRATLALQFGPALAQSAEIQVAAPMF